MILLKNLQINKASKLNSQISFISKNFSNITNDVKIKQLITKLSLICSIPESTVELEIKQFISSKFDYGKGRFTHIFHLKRLFLSSLIFLFKFFYIAFFSKLIKKQNYYDLIIDDITSNELKVSNGIVQHFNSYLLLGNKNLKTNLNYSEMKSLRNYSRKLILKKFLNFLLLFLFSLKTSFTQKVNLIPIFSHVVLRFLKYQSMFETNVAKTLINIRPIIKSSIRNFLFKKNGGKLTASIQKSLNGYGYADFFYDTDILFSTGTRSFLINNSLSCEIKKVIPVGSLALEQYWHKEKKIKSYEFDVVNLAGNSTNTPDILKHLEYDEDYYKQFEWMVKIEKKFPQLKIGIKHHKSLRIHDQKEIKIIKNSRIKRIINDNSNGRNKSYNIGFFSNFTCTWCSMIAYELLSLNKPCFFLDPGGRNDSFFQDDEINDFWRIKTYEEFENKVLEIVMEKKIIKIEKPDKFCLESTDVSKKISETLKKYGNLD